MKLLLVAGEVSGDHHGAALLQALKARRPGLDVFGVGGDRCAALGMRLLAHQKELAVVGLVEAISKILLARRLIARLVLSASREGAQGAILIDSPDFNMPLARRLRKAGIPVVFYVSPQVWAWRSGRAKKLVSMGRAVLVLFGFEKRWYDARGLGERVRWVGHPLVSAAARELGAAPGAPRVPAGIRKARPRVVLMPGSRASEIRRHLRLMLDAVAILRRTVEDLDVVLVRADSISEELLEECAGAPLSDLAVVSGAHLALLAASDVLLVASGTATVEGLLACVPMVVVYRVNPLTFALARRLVKVPHIAMANIVSDDGTRRRAVPELVQSDATPERLAEEAALFLKDPSRAAEARQRLRHGLADLGPPGAAERTAEAVLQALERHKEEPPR